MERDVFELFPGGRAGIQERLKVLVRSGIESLSISCTYAKFENLMGLRQGLIENILNDGDYMESHLHVVLGCLGIALDELLGEIVWPSDEAKAWWTSKMKAAGFCCVSAPLDDDTLLRLYLRGEAISEFKR